MAEHTELTSCEQPSVESRCDDAGGISEITILPDGRVYVLGLSAAILDVVVGNLLRNAIFHSESTEVEVELGAHSLTVRDFGRGIPTEMQSRMFDRHVSAGGDPARDLGIGLALVNRICAHFRWELSMDSTPGKGTAIAVDFGDSIRKG